jgi:hypothetical protein
MTNSGQPLALMKLVSLGRVTVANGGADPDPAPDHCRLVRVTETTALIGK